MGRIVGVTVRASTSTARAHPTRVSESDKIGDGEPSGKGLAEATDAWLVDLANINGGDWLGYLGPDGAPRFLNAPGDTP